MALYSEINIQLRVEMVMSVFNLSKSSILNLRPNNSNPTCRKFPSQAENDGVQTENNLRQLLLLVFCRSIAMDYSLGFLASAKSYHRRFTRSIKHNGWRYISRKSDVRSILLYSCRQLFGRSDQAERVRRISCRASRTGG